MNLEQESSERDPLEQIAELFLARRRAGENPALSDYERQHPDLAADIRDLFPALLMMEEGRACVDKAPAAAPAAGVDTVRRSARLQVPPGASPEQVTRGERIYLGQASNGTCAGCHGSNALGTPQGPPLDRNHWMWSDGSLAGISDIIQKGVLKPRRYQGIMPPYGGSPLSKEDLAAVTAYVWAVAHSDDR